MISLITGTIGLLVASRAQTIETVSGLMNAVMLPMWIGSGIFFSTDRFPEAVQPWLAALPLTPLIHSMRSGTMLQPGERQGCVGCHADRNRPRSAM